MKFRGMLGGLAMVAIAACSEPTAPGEIKVKPSLDWSGVTTDCASHGTRPGGVVQVGISPNSFEVWTNGTNLNMYHSAYAALNAGVWRDDSWTFGTQIFCRDYAVDVTFTYTATNNIDRSTLYTETNQYTVAHAETSGPGNVIASYAGKADTATGISWPAE